MTCLRSQATQCRARTLTKLTSNPDGLAAPGNHAPTQQLGHSWTKEMAAHFSTSSSEPAGRLLSSGLNRAWIHPLPPSQLAAWSWESSFTSLRHSFLLRKERGS